MQEWLAKKATRRDWSWTVVARYLASLSEEWGPQRDDQAGNSRPFLFLTSSPVWGLIKDALHSLVVV